LTAPRRRGRICISSFRTVSWKGTGGIEGEKICMLWKCDI
jgi:hypothetical protein